MTRTLAAAESLAPRLVRLVPRNVRRVFVYGCVGLAVSVFYSLAVVACVTYFHSLSPTLAGVFAFGITLPVAYLAHARVSFSDSTYDQFQPLRFVISTASSFTLNVGGMYVITKKSPVGVTCGESPGTG
jgi:putative flippase GtrA